MNTTIRIPVSKTLKQQAERLSLQHGFALEEIVSILLQRFVKRKITVTGFEDEEVTFLSPRAEKRYEKALKDIKAGRNVTKTSNIDELLSLLHK